MQKAAPGDIVIGLLGASVIALTLIGLIVVEGRPGPYERDLTPTEVPIVTRGTFERSAGSGTIGPGGLCIPEPPASTCSAPRTFLDLEIDGLPHVDGATYHAFLTDRLIMPLGPLTRTGATHIAHHESATDTTAARRLVVTLEVDDPAEPSDREVFTFDLTAAATDFDLDAAADARLAAGTGWVRLNEIGAVTTSTTTVAEVEPASDDPLFVLNGWLIDAEGQATQIGTFEPGIGDAAMLDVRIERLPLAGQERFLVMLDVADAPAATAPRGFPMYEAVLVP